MAVNDNMRDDPQRDPRLARLLNEAGGEEPPSALDHVILAAAHREVGARPQSSDANVLPLVKKRSWYVPVSIAAVLVLSVSLVTLVHEEKGDELLETPRSASRPVPPAPATPAAKPADSVQAPAEAESKLKDSASGSAGQAEQPKRDAPLLREESAASPAAAVADAAYDLAKKQRAPTTAQQAPALRQDQPSGPPAQAEREQRPAPEAFPASRDVRDLRDREATLSSRAESDDSRAKREVARAEPVPRADVPPPPTAASAPKTDAPVETQRRQATTGQLGGQFSQQAPRASIGIRGFDSSSSPESRAENRASGEGVSGYSGPAPATAPAPAAKVAPPPPAKAAARIEEKSVRSPIWRGLEDQPPEKWLERLADLRRDNRNAEADELLMEFRRRFPDHPAAR